MTKAKRRASGYQARSANRRRRQRLRRVAMVAQLVGLFIAGQVFAIAGDAIETVKPASISSPDSVKALNAGRERSTQ